MQAQLSNIQSAINTAVARAEERMDAARTRLEKARQVGGEVAGALGHVGRAHMTGAAQVRDLVARHNREAIADGIDVGRKSLGAKCLGELARLHADYAARRANAYFASVGELNELVADRARAAWAPLGDVIESAGVTQAAPRRTSKARKTARA
jgi:hypothetical protein